MNPTNHKSTRGCCLQCLQPLPIWGPMYTKCICSLELIQTG